MSLILTWPERLLLVGILVVLVGPLWVAAGRRLLVRRRRRREESRRGFPVGPPGAV